MCPFCVVTLYPQKMPVGSASISFGSDRMSLLGWASLYRSHRPFALLQ